MAAFANTPMLLISATSRMPHNLNEWQANGFIEKPFQKKELLKKIEELIAEKNPA